MHRRFFWVILLAGVTSAVIAGDQHQPLKLLPTQYQLQVHEAIVHANLALFPVTSARLQPTGDYITLEEGLKAGQVEVKELGAPLIRLRPGGPRPTGAQVNSLALVNNSKKALLLLAGEIVTGGKQDRIISKDRIIPPGAEPLPLDVFCVEPGRWHGSSMGFASGAFMAAPKLRKKAAIAKNQQEVWNATRELREGVAERMVTEADTALAYSVLGRSSSYAQLESSDVFRVKIDQASANLRRNYERALRGALKGKNVVGVVVAVNGEVVWADLFANPELFERYWPKLLPSYVVEALSVPVKENAQASLKLAERFLAEQDGKQIIEIEPGEYRLLQVSNPRFSILEIASLWKKGQEPILHYTKLRKESVRPGRSVPIGPQPLVRRR